MSKKKRNKHYKGSAAQRPVVMHVSAVRRNPVHQWWVDHKRLARPALIIAGIVLAVLVIIIGIIDIIF